jgi:competence protein ComEA
MERRPRFVLWLVSTCLAFALFIQGRGISSRGVPAAFLHGIPAGIAVRLKGSVSQPGVYWFSAKPDAQTVISMTAPPVLGKVANRALLTTRLENGDIVEVHAVNGERFEIATKKMKATEKMTLGIPLVPDELDLDDWESLPGIGPGLAKNIMSNRQKYGDFGAIESLERVPGVGEKKLKELKRYF